MAGSSKRLPSAKQKASNLFYLWHTIQDVKAQAAAMRDAELLMLIDMVGLLIEERTTALAAPAAVASKPASRRPQRHRNGVVVEQGMAAA